jgi:DNA-binding winged helix-turn-helix (wHTH) protein
MSKSYKFGPFRLTGKTLFRGEEEVRITQRQLKILRYLIEHRDRAVSGDDLLDEFWPDAQVELNNVTQNISALRKALGDNARKPKYIETTEITNDYRFVATVVEEIEKGEAPVEGLVGGSEGKTNELQPSVVDSSVESSTGRGEPKLESIIPAVEAVPLEHSGGEEITVLGLLRSADRIDLSFILAGSLLTLVLAVWGIALHSQEGIKLYVSLPQILLVFLAAVYVPRGPNRLSEQIDEDPRHIAEEALKRYRLYWRLIWVTWCALYLSLLAMTPEKKEWEEVITVTINNANTAILFLCYNILNQPVVIKKGKHEIDDASWIGGGIILVGIYLFAEYVVMTVVPDINDQRQVTQYGLSLISGIAGGVGMALLVGRLQSKFLGPSRSLVIALYSYTAIQSLFIFLVGFPKGKELFDQPTELRIGVLLITTALMLKCLLYLYMARLFKSGDLLFYFVKVRQTYLNVDEERDQFRKYLKQES